MTSSFSTHWPKSMGPEYAGKPNHFVEKIWQSFPDGYTAEVFNDYLDGLEKVGYDFNIDANLMRPKKHTFRTDLNDRWKVGMKIHPVINNRTKNRFQFAQVMEVKGIQEIDIKITSINSEGIVSGALVWVDRHYLGGYCAYGNLPSHSDLEKLAINDGFNSVEQFFAWFNKDFTGKIIHWTTLKY